MNMISQWIWVHLLFAHVCLRQTIVRMKSGNGSRIRLSDPNALIFTMHSFFSPYYWMLVGALEHLPFSIIFRYIGNHHPNWLSNFSEAWLTIQDALDGQLPSFGSTFPAGARGSPAVDQQGPLLGQGWVPRAAPAPWKDQEMELELGLTSFFGLFWKGSLIFQPKKNWEFEVFLILLAFCPTPSVLTPGQVSTTQGGVSCDRMRIALTQCIMIMIMTAIITMTTTTSMVHPMYFTYERSFDGLIEWKPFGIQWCCHQATILVWLKVE